MVFSALDAEIVSKMVKLPGRWRCSDCEYESRNKNNMYEHIECRQFIYTRTIVAQAI